MGGHGTYMQIRGRMSSRTEIRSHPVWNVEDVIGGIRSMRSAQREIMLNKSTSFEKFNADNTQGN